MFEKLKTEPVRKYLYTLAAAVVGLLVALGILSGDLVPYVLAIVVGALALPSPVESLRNQVTPTATVPNEVVDFYKAVNEKAAEEPNEVPETVGRKVGEGWVYIGTADADDMKVNPLPENVIDPDAIQLNTVTQNPSEKAAEPNTIMGDLNTIKERYGAADAALIYPFDDTPRGELTDVNKALYDTGAYGPAEKTDD